MDWLLTNSPIYPIVPLLAQAGAGDAAIAESIDWLGLVVRVIHLLSAVTLAGGCIYWRLVLVPSLAEQGGESDETLEAAMRRRWSKIVGATAGLLILTGLYTMAMRSITFKLPMVYNLLFGVKFLLALVLFYAAMLLAGRSAAAERARQNAAFWHSLCMWLAILIIAIAGVLQAIPKPKKPPKTPATAQSLSHPRVSPAVNLGGPLSQYGRRIRLEV